MMASSGLIAIMAGWFVPYPQPSTSRYGTYLSTAVVNFFVPSSAASSWSRAPSWSTAGQALGVSAATIVNSFSAGEVIGNMFQPFWAIPLLGIGRIEDARHHGLLHPVLPGHLGILSLSFLLF
jgi:short-chain fatty acids transporter